MIPRSVFSWIIITIVLLVENSLCISKKNPLYEGEKLADFFVSCTSEAKEPCKISSPDDFKRLHLVKGYVRNQLDFFTSSVRLGASMVKLSIICILMIHLTIVRRFDWRTLPIINMWYYEIQEEQDRQNGVRYHQFVWMKYCVLEGNHAAFAKRNKGEIKWYKYKKQKKFDYKSVKIEKFTFLDKAMLTKHLTTEPDKHDHDHEKEEEGHKP